LRTKKVRWATKRRKAGRAERRKGKGEKDLGFFKFFSNSFSNFAIKQ
jgi:hypothetical protein